MQLLVHTKYSFFESDIDIGTYLENLSLNNEKYAAITDKNNIYGMWEFIKLSKEKNIFPIVGVHIAAKLKNSLYSNGGFLMFLKSLGGYHAFNSIITTSTNEKSFSYVYDKISYFSAKNELDELIFISCNLNIYKTLSCLSIPAKNLYFGLIEDIFTNKPFLSNNLIQFFENTEFSNPIFLSKIFYNKPIDYKFIDILATCRINKLLKRENKINKKREPVYEKFSSVCNYFYLSEDPNFLKNRINPYSILSNKAKEMILNSIGNAKNFHFHFSEIKPIKQFFPIFFENSEEKIKNICLKSLKEKGLDKDEKYISRLNYELDIIRQKGFTQYFLFVYEIISYAKANNILFLGRGSAASSLVSYLLGITEIDPIKFNLYFERFLNPARESFPDIDIDFSWKEREKILQFLFKKYPSNCCMVSTNITMSLKGAFRNCAKFFGMEEEKITKYSKLIPAFISTNNIDKIKIFLYEIGIDDQIVKYTLKLLNLPYAKGTHPGGIVFSSPDILNSTPFLYGSKGLTISHFDLNYIEYAGLIKIDILSQRALQVLQDAIKNIREIDNKNFYINFEIANSDEETWKNISQGDCRGCFYIESPAMINLLRELKAGNFLELVAASSVIRPGVSDSGMKDEYISRKRNLKNFEYDIPILKDILGETFGVMIYQEDVLKVASIVGNLSLSEADFLRKSMNGKGRSIKQIKLLKNKFINGGLANKYNIKTLEKIWSQIESFAGYAFCKAHSASYAVLSVILAYIRTHFPAFFYAAILNNFGGYYPSFAYNILALLENIAVDICRFKNAVRYTYYDGNKIIIGLCNFFFLSESERELIIDISKSLKNDEKFLLSKFIVFSNLNKQKIMKLIQIGFFDDCYNSSNFTKILCETLFEEKEKDLKILINKEKELLNIEKFFYKTNFSIYYYRYKYLGLFVDITPFQLLQVLIEKDFLNESEEEIIKNYFFSNSNNFKQNFINILGWTVTFRSAMTKDGELMGFATFFNGKNFVETILFPDIYKRYYNLLKYFNFFILKIKIENSNTFLIDEIKPFLPDFFERLKEA